MTPRSASPNDDGNVLIAEWLVGLVSAPLSVETARSLRKGPEAVLLGALALRPEREAGARRMRDIVLAGETDEGARDLSREFTLLFDGVGGPRTASPYESAYFGVSGRLFQGPTSDLNALLRRAGVSVRADVKEPADHLSIELALLGRMTRDGASRRDPREFLDLHLLAFTPMFTIKCRDADRTGFYAAAADLMLGFLGAPGGGYGLSYHYGSTGTPTADSPVLLGISEGVSTLHPPIWPIDGVCSAIPVSRIVEMLENPGKPFDFNGVRSSYPDVRLAYWVGGNPFARRQHRNQMLEAWRRLKTFIVHDYQWTATARRADIVLPATTAFERDDIERVGDFSLSSILPMKRVIDPAFEARDHCDIFADIAARLGKGDAFAEGKSEMDWIRSFYERAMIGARGKGMEMPEFDSFWKSDDALTFPTHESGARYVQHAVFRDDPLLNTLGTRSGRIEIFSSGIANMNYANCPPHPTWMEPVERLGGPTTKFPLHIDSAHPKYRLRSRLIAKPRNRRQGEGRRCTQWF